MNDEELSRLLKQWDAPATPRTLERRVFPAPVWRPWAMIGAAAAIVILTVVLISRKPDRLQGGLAGFQPVTELKPRIVRSALHETK